MTDKYKIIFLDIDGVFNTEESSMIVSFSEVMETCRLLPSLKRKDISYFLKLLDPRLISIFNRLIFLSGAKVVLSSSWRKYVKLEHIRVLLQVRGAKFDIIDTTPWGKPYTERKDEIMEWVKTHDFIESIVIVDDCPISATPTSLNKKLVLVDPTKGFSEKDMSECQKILFSKD